MVLGVGRGVKGIPLLHLIVYPYPYQSFHPPAHDMVSQRPDKKKRDLFEGRLLIIYVQKGRAEFASGLFNFINQYQIGILLLYEAGGDGTIRY